MTIEVIDKYNIVHNKVELHDKQTFVYSSEEFEHANLTDLPIIERGLYGNIPVKSNNSKCIKYIKYNHQFADDENVGKLHITSEVSANINSERIVNVPIPGSRSYYISNDYNNDYKFGIDRIKRKYLVRDINTDKINAVIKLYDYYRQNMTFANYKSMLYGFRNYSCLNLYTIGKINKNSNTYDHSKTHKNMLVYPNLLNASGKNVYDFTATKTLTTSFFINPNKKNVKDGDTVYEYNAGCVLYIHDLLSIHIVKGSKTDQNGLVDAFRLYLAFGANAKDKVKYTDIKFNDPDLQSKESNQIVLSSDNILKFNCWQNVCVSITETAVANSYAISIFVDGVLVDSLTQLLTVPAFSSSNNSFIAIGNKPKEDIVNNNTNLGKFIKKCFTLNSIKLDGDEDLDGPARTKHIGFGKNIVDITVDDDTTPYDDNNDHTDLENLLINSSQTRTNTSIESFSFHGEIHDIRIYNISCDENFAKSILNYSVKDDTKDSLLFYVPFYYLPIVVSKKGIDTIYKKNNKISLQDISYNFVTNPYFFNSTGSHDLSVENFVVEFVNKVSPNIILNCDYRGLSDYDSYTELTDDSIKKIAQKGECIYDFFIEECYKTSNFSLDNKSVVYRNHMILPCDNGIQEQKFKFIFNQYCEEEKNSHLFEVHKNYYDNSVVLLDCFYDKQNLKKTFEYNNNNEVSLNVYEAEVNMQLKSKEVFLRTVIDNNKVSNSNLSTTLRVTYLTNYMPENLPINNSNDNEYTYLDNFTSRKDDLWNASNRSYHSDDFDISNDSYDSTIIGYESSYRWYAREPKSVSLNNKFKSKANPAQRDITSMPRVVDNEILYANVHKTTSDGNKSIEYKVKPLPLFDTDYNITDYHTVLFSISNQLYRRKIKPGTFSISDVDYWGSGGKLSFSVSDDENGVLYRSDCLTKKAEWNFVGHIMYNEGFCTITHPGLSSMCRSNYKIDLSSMSSLNIHEVNIPASAGMFNQSRNKSYIEDLRMDDSAFNSDEDFVYITDINLHDENLNIVAKSRLARPFAKKNSDNVLFRLKMDY